MQCLKLHKLNICAIYHKGLRIWVAACLLHLYSLLFPTCACLICFGCWILQKKRKIDNNSNMCHQCQRNDSGRVVRCQGCIKREKRFRYCVKCIKRWYVPFLKHLCWDCICLIICFWAVIILDYLIPSSVACYFPPPFFFWEKFPPPYWSLHVNLLFLEFTILIFTICVLA